MMLLTMLLMMLLILLLIVARKPPTLWQQYRPCAARDFVPSTPSYAQMAIIKKILK